MKKTPKVLVLSGYGLNCEEETLFAFASAGALGKIIHINDLIEKPALFNDFDILAFPGGFSFGDDTGSGKAYANKIKNHLAKHIEKFLARDTLVIGICNGFQILTQLGLLPGALLFNDSARYIDRWVDIKVGGNSPWLTGMKTISVPIAHGEGKYTLSKKEIAAMQKRGEIAFTYTKGPISKFQNLPANPNGAMEDIAGVLGYNGRVLGMMPHPERALVVTNYPNWYELKEEALRSGKKLPKEGEGKIIFKNAVNYFLKR